MTAAYLNCIAVAVPDHDIHEKFVSYAPRLLLEEKDMKLFQRAASRAQISHRYSFLLPSPEESQLDAEGFYNAGSFPDTHRRMKRYERHAFDLAARALDQIDLQGVTHLLITTCTGFYAPGLDMQIAHHYGLSPAVERTVIGFMGCSAAMNALKLARHIVRSDKKARVAILNIELCTLHMQEGRSLEETLSFLIFADGCAASIVSSDPKGLELESFHAALLPHSADQLTWRIGGLGFDMTLSGRLPGTISAALPEQIPNITRGRRPENIAHWALHPGGRSVLDAVRDGIGLDEKKLNYSRGILRRYGNMSSASIMFVLKDIMENGEKGRDGCAIAFGPGLTAESMCFAA
jgi:alpha-pyrone synthase